MKLTFFARVGLLLMLVQYSTQGAEDAKGTASSPTPLTCWYAERSGELAPHSRCATQRGDTLQISARHLQRMVFDQDDLATLRVAGQHYYVRRDGKTLAVITFDNGADYYSEGLVRGQHDGKIGFYDRRFNPVIPPRYDWAWPFEDGVAKACQGCVPIYGAHYWVDNAHLALSEGRWFYIDRRGRETGPVPER
ncbi:WG repeat-containing protein [Chitinolyticbacter albus]|uniref:WG repeat-containing protein n=1 Tax=Chitinolyticbacter albus TaxID=2961951 RepID=UPI00210DE316|nr:WG repeat-containing protein [Chitinolyticbacter albus]